MLKKLFYFLFLLELNRLHHQQQVIVHHFLYDHCMQYQ